MNDDLESILERLAPPGPRPELRDRVLAALGHELERRVGQRGMWFSALAAAAAVTVSVTLNYWADRTVATRLDRIVGPAPLQRDAQELANDVGAVTDAETGRWFYRRVTSRRDPPGSFRHYLIDYQRILKEFQLAGKGDSHEEVPPLDRHRRGRDRGDTSWDQRLFRVEEWRPA